MARVFRFVVGLMLLMASVLVAQIDQPWTQRSVEMEAERLRDARRSAAASVDQVAAYFSVAQDRDTELYLLNLITDPVAVEISVVSPTGHRLGLGTLTVEANQHAALSLRTWLDSASKEFSEGSLWLRYLGDAETLQAWTVYHNGNQSFEIPLVGPNELLLGGSGGRRSATLPTQCEHLVSPLHRNGRGRCERNGAPSRNSRAWQPTGDAVAPLSWLDTGCVRRP